MSLVSCPSCRNELEIPPELLGGPVRCANCLTVFSPPVAEVPTVAVAKRIASDRDEFQFDDAKPSRSRAWLWLLLFGCTLLTCTCFGSCAGLIGIQAKPAMKPYAAGDGRFTASFPGNPNPVFKTANDGREILGVEVVRILPSEEHYFVEYIVLVDKELTKDDQKIAADTLAKWMQDQNGTIMETDVIDHKGLPAAQIFGQFNIFGGRGNVVARAVRDGDRLYIVGVSGAVAQWNDRVEKFLDDFTPQGAPDNGKQNDPPAKGARKKNPFKGD